MRFLCIATLVFMSVLTLAQTSETARDRKVIAAAKAVYVSKLETRLPPMPFNQWLRMVAGPGARITYEVNDCGEQTGTAADRERDFPMCVEAVAEERDHRVTIIALAVGTLRRGAFGEPSVAWVRAGCDRYSAEPLKKLSDIVRSRTGNHQPCPIPQLAPGRPS
jgi:hypothetical protein